VGTRSPDALAQLLAMQIDGEILRQLREGHPTAYEWLVAHFEGTLYRYFLCAHRDHHLAEEQTAETFAQLVRSLPSMTGGPTALPAFVFAVARHTKLRHWRNPKLRNCSIESASEAADPRPTPAVQSADREQVERILYAISAIESGARDVMLLRFVEEYSINEVALALDMPVGTVKSHIHRGREQLMNILSKSECHK
jgi:RNA polymerase sigma-70 factor (ECF subfamily)